MRFMQGFVGIALSAMVLAAPSAFAAPADLDTSFGTNGIAQLPSDKYAAQYAPLLDASGKVLTVGLLKNDSDRAFVERFTSAGAVDTNFGNAGDVHTNTIAAQRSAPSTLTSDGKILVAGGASNKGRITLERFNADGSSDLAYGGAGNGRLTVDVGGPYITPTQVISLSPTSTLVVGIIDTGGFKLTLLKFTNTGLDPTFGTGGVARAPFSKWSTSQAATVLSNGSILVAGEVGDSTLTSKYADTAIARFTSAGALDTSFNGTGYLQTDLSGNSTNDYAESIVADATGAFAVAGQAGTRGMVARFTSTGAKDTSFGTSGVQFLTPGTTSTNVTGMVLDGSGRMVLSGSATSGTTTKWLVGRLNRSSGSALDTSFAPGGLSQLLPCTNVSGNGASGLTIDSSSRILLAGSCGDAGAVAVARFYGVAALPTGASLTVSPTRESAGHERVPLSNIDPTTVLGAVDKFVSAPLGSGPLGSGPLGSGPLGSGPLGSGPLGSGPLGSGPLGSGPLGSGPLGSGPLGSGPLGSGPVDEQILLSDLPLLNGQTWTQLLAPYYSGGNVPPLQTITLADAYRLAPALIDSLKYSDIDITRTPLRRASLAAVLLTRPLQYVDPPTGGWCTWLNANQPKKNCTNGVDITKTTLLELEFAGDDLSGYYATPLQLAKSAGTDLGTGGRRAMLAFLDLRQVDTKSTPIGSVPAAQLSDLLACGSSCTGTVADQQANNTTGWTKSGVTIGDLVAKVGTAAVPALPSLSLGQLLAGLVNVGEIPYESASTSALLNAASLRSNHLQTYTDTFDIACDQAAGLKVVPDLADNARLIPGSATVTVGNGSATALPNATKGADGKYAYDVSSACAGKTGVTHIVVSFQAEPGSRLGPQQASVTVRSDYGSVSAGKMVAIDDSLDPGNGPTDALPITTDKVIHGWVSDASDVDTYTFQAPAAGTRVSLTLTHVPQDADFDLHVYGPSQDIATAQLHSGPLGSGPLGSGPLGSGAVPDSTGDAIDPSIVEPDHVQDLPLGSGPLGSGPLGSGSINRGSSDEAVTFRVRQADVGKTITVQVVGYNGSSSRDPYVLRRGDIVAAPAPACPARTIVPGTAGTWPTDVPSTTQTLYLVNRARLSGLNNEAQATDVMNALNQVKAATNGVIVPVESDPNTSTSSLYSAWDAAPCDESNANAVVTGINKVVDDIKQAGGGLKQLRSIVLVGPDAVIPQARIRDDAVLSNEFEYANDAMIGGNDDAVSGSLRDGYLLSDDPYGDFDVSKTMFVPDVALGRLVETAPEITAQLTAFDTNHGVIDPQNASVLGYDFFSDGADVESSAFRAAGFGTTARNDQWDATTALAAINRNPSGFTAVNGHYDSHRALPSAAFSGTNPNLLYARDADPQPGTVLFTMGCHSGLNISATALNPSAADQLKLGDWAQKMAQSKALWTGSTGFSYGDTEAVAYTERIMAEMASNMASKKVTVGQALMYAKQRSLASAGVLDVYYTKASQEATFYGMPMYRITSDGGNGESGMPPAAPSGAGTQSSDPLSFDLASRLRAHTDSRGTYYSVDNEAPLTVQNHPLEPITSKDVTDATKGQAHGYLIEGLTTQDLAASDPVIARPTVDLSAHEPEPVTTSPFFPASLATVTNEATANGRLDRLTVSAGQYRGDHQRNITNMSGRIMRSSGNDFTPLVIKRVDGKVIGNTFDVRVDVDGNDAVGGNVLYRTNADTAATVTWRRADLAVINGNLLAAGAALPSGATKVTEAIVQVYDNGYNVSLSDYKIVNYSFQPIPQNDPAVGPNITFTPNPTGTYATTSPQVSIDSGQHSTATFQYRINGGPWQPYTGSFAIPEPADGLQYIEVQGSDGSHSERPIFIDRIGPTTIAEPDRSSNAFGWYNGPVTVNFRCTDAGPAGVASCPASKTQSTDTDGVTISGTSTDNAGNVGAPGSVLIRIDSVKPTISGAPQANGASDPHTGLDGNQWYWNAPTLKWTCTDDRSGIAFCPADGTGVEGVNAAQTKTAKDKADNTKDGTMQAYNADLSDGTVAITTADNSVLLPNQKVRGTATDTAKGSGINKVQVTYTLGSRVETKPGILSCTDAPANRTCTWTADLPSTTGVGWMVKASATENSGRPFDAASTIFVTVNGAPTLG